MSNDEIRALLNDFVNAWQRQDVKALAAYYANDCEVVSPIFRSLSGRVQVEQSFADVFRAFTHQSIRIDDIVISSEPPARSVLVCTLQSMHVGELFGMPPSGRRIERTIAFIQTLVDGKIKRETRIYDYTSMLVQLGVLRVKAG